MVVGGHCAGVYGGASGRCHWSCGLGGSSCCGWGCRGGGGRRHDGGVRGGAGRFSGGHCDGGRWGGDHRGRGDSLRRGLGLVAIANGRD